MAARAHIVLPEDLIEQVDRVAGKRKRSRFVEDAIREKLSREALNSALSKTAGSLDPTNYPEWPTPEAVSSWVRGMRQDLIIATTKHLRQV